MYVEDDEFSFKFLVIHIHNFLCATFNVCVFRSSNYVLVKEGENDIE